MSSDDDDILILDDAAFEAIDQIAVQHGKLPPKTAVNVPGLQQRDLFGGVVKPKPPPQPQAGSSRAGFAQGKSRTVTLGGPSNGLVKETTAKTKNVKQWDAASFAKHGWSKRTAAEAKKKAKGGKGKGKQKATDLDEEEEVLEDESDEDDGFVVDTSYDPKAPPLPIKWPPDPVASQTWVYPMSPEKPLRSYQYNICHVALFQNTLVSLPTGLGKTFIAAVVMLNFYRWYPKGKIIFMAPSRPLVRQQVQACHYIAGIPQSDCVELTGTTMPKLRAIGWATKRLIYSTPQTVENDLRKGRVDPRDIVCIVVDEAHKASGDYAYCSVVRYMMSRNRHFRVLALTATPGSKHEAVQDVIDNLHITSIQVRTDASLDIRQYMHTKSYNLCVLPLGEILGSIRDRWAKLMQAYLNPLVAAKLVFQTSAEYLSPFVVTLAFAKVKGLPGGAQTNGKYFPMIKTLSTMARAMEYLVVQSLSEFDSVMKDLQGSNEKVRTNPEFQSIAREVRNLRDRAGYVGHPKMEKLRSMCLEHFQACENEIDPLTGGKRQTRVMVFCNYRAVVDEIVTCLNTQRPMIKATPFVGQASGKTSKGMSQKEQIETIKKFKAGTYNVMVASSIGEEGLDIGEIDLIVCYEANKSPIRMLQRVGRTGRARDGHIIVLMTEGREEKNWEKAKEQYEDVQNALVSTKIFELYADGDRMLPDNVKPTCDKVEIKARALDMASIVMTGQSGIERKALAAAARDKKPKKARDPNRNMPADAFQGFRSAGQLAALDRQALQIAPTQAVRDRRKVVYLDEEQETYLRTRWQTTDGSVAPTLFDLSRLPFERGMSGSALGISWHSSRHGDLLAIMSKLETLDDSHPDELDAWHDEMSRVYKPDLIRVWNPANRRGPAPKQPQLRRPPVKVTLPSSSPGLFDARDLEPEPSTATAKSVKAPLQTPSSTLTGSERDDGVLQAAPALARAAAVPEARPAQSVARVGVQEEVGRDHVAKPPSIPLDADISATLDVYNVLSSDDEAPRPISRSNAAPPVAADPRVVLPVETLEIDSSDDDLPAFDLSDSQLIAGDKINGRQPTAAVGVNSVTPALRDAVPASPELVPDSEDELHADLLSANDDSCGFLDMADDELELVMRQAEQAAAAKREQSAQPVVTPVQSEQDADDSALMPPPVISVNKRVKSRARVVQSESPDVVAQALPQVSHTALADRRASKNVVAAAAKPALRRRMVVDSSSPGVVGEARQTVLTSESKGQSSASAPRVLKRLRRRQNSDGDSDEEVVVDKAPPKRKKVKRPKVTDKDLARNNLLDFEAVNSEASGTEASSEAYQSEDSEDRAFVASEGEDDEVSEGQAQFYRESLLSQAPGFHTKLGAFGGNGVHRRRSGPVDRGSPMTPITPNSQDEWSYDSFCVHDDEEIEIEPSSDRL
ncbi:hypothetical protein ACM66B_002372 [Microbotryomycetes sp. NB124-2]